MTRTWKIDGEVVRFGEIIKRAEGYGYEGCEGVFLTSAACRYLERNGHKVECIESEAQSE